MESLCPGLLCQCYGVESLSGLELIQQQACFGGMLFGMDSGIIGGVLTMPPFMS
jgi:hypothetical protein